ncbi:hypothetical protein G6O69_07010 [Pseudenhygromyxa sp. WMMC2535]|uniref:hypothetical protein n=1 Tax=Pseudenhygromyxa sp. WMMC2535 TaxID=2712867 RepID=UPI001557E2C7|nr:hypothetical protein [Pseudenhygromyxa sp. WMMC2535]NVB37576.1 hypothetical protein [Pseudenhygromyxa sp. WMMC2535]
MQLFSSSLLPLSLLSAALSLTACKSTTSPEPTTPDSTDEPAPAEAAAAADFNFGCEVDHSALQPWTAEGMELPEETIAKFALWTVLDTDQVPEMVSQSCTNPPPSGQYSPVKAALQGGVTRGDMVVVLEDVTIYRAFTAQDTTTECLSDSPAGEIGAWWSVIEPQDPKEAYRDNVGICPAWNDLSMMVTCTLEAGSVVIIGPTQSASCTGTSSCDPAPEGWDADLPTTSAPQLFINTYANGERRSEEELGAFIECETPVAWAS